MLARETGSCDGIMHAIPSKVLLFSRLRRCVLMGYGQWFFFAVEASVHASM